MPLNVPLVDTFGPYRQSIGQLTNALQDAPRMQMERLQLGEAQRHQQENQELQQLMARTPATQRPQVAIQFLESKGRTQDAAILKHERFQQFHDQYQIDPQSAITAFPEYGVDPSRANQITTSEIPGTKSVAVKQGGKTSFLQRDPTDAEVQSEATARAKGTMEGGRKTPEELLQDVTQAGAVAGAQEEARQKFKPDPREQGIGKTVVVGGRVKQLDPATNRYTIDIGPAPPKEAATVTIQTMDKEGNPITKVMTKQQALEASAGEGGGIKRPPAAITLNRIVSAKNSLKMGNKILKYIEDPKVQAGMGPAMGRVTGWKNLIGNPPPELSELSGMLKSWSELQPAVHGMRSSEMAEDIERSVPAKFTPQALAGFIRGFQHTAQTVADSEKADTDTAPAISVQESTSKSGKPIISKDGGKTWEYK